jgi:3'(2'), 5'-bisphosphate nucleotidase
MTHDDHRLAHALAEEAGERLLVVRGRFGADVTDPAELKELGDRLSHEWLMEALAESRPDDAVLSEEGADDQARVTATRAWIIDPLDGTREFSEPPREDWAVHVALVVAEQVVAAAVALPAAGMTMSTAEIPPPPPVGSGPIRLVVSRTRPPALSEELARRLDGVLVPMGSAGAKAMAVVRGEADVYAHAGGQYEWDSAAPVGVAAAAGLHVSRLDGSTLCYNQPNPWLPDLLVCRADLAERVLAELRELEW